MSEQNPPTPQTRLSAYQIWRDWSVEGALWLMENPRFFETYFQECMIALQNINQHNINQPAQAALLRDFASAPHGELRESVANNPVTPADLLLVLAQDAYLGVRNAVAQHAHTPHAALEQLAVDEYWWVRASVAKNSQTPAHVLAMLANDDDRDVRESVLHHHNTPKSLAEEIKTALNAQNDLRQAEQATVQVRLWGRDHD